MSDRISHEDWRIIDSILPLDMSRNSVIKLIDICNKYSWLCPVDKCDHIYGNKQRLERHLGKKHPGDPGIGDIKKSVATNTKKLITWVGMGTHLQPTAASGSRSDDSGSHMQMPVNMMELDGLSPHGSPEYWNNQTQSPSNRDAAGSGLDSGAGTQCPPAQTTRSQAATGQQAWITPGIGSGSESPYGQPYLQSEPSGQSSSDWTNNCFNQGSAISIPSLPTIAYFNPQIGEANASIRFPSSQAHIPSFYGQQQEH